MKRTPAVLLSCLLLASTLVAKAPLSKIKIEGADLAVPIEITDANVLADFNVWSGPGTGWAANGVTHWDSSSESFIVSWSRKVTERLKKSRHYQVSFYARFPEERLIYVVSYEFDPATATGYVHLPGKNEHWYNLNVRTIFHGVEGNWFCARSAWDDLAMPLITQARMPGLD
jgi:hypothetical protein